jgi:hypothetical protein
LDTALLVMERLEVAFLLGNPRLPGNADTWFLVHCGSLSEPYDTLKDLHSKNSKPIGTANSRSRHVAFDARGS